jgi:hypothetical protein
LLRIHVKCILTGTCVASLFQISFAQPIPTLPSSAYRSEQVRVIAVIPVRVENTSDPSNCQPSSPPGLTVEGSSNSVCNAQNQSQKFKAIYELGGQQFSVILPTEPGDFLELETPTSPVNHSNSELPPDNSTPLPSATQATYTQTYAYPYVLFLGMGYRPLPYLGGVARPHRGPLGVRGYGRGRR